MVSARPPSTSPSVSRQTVAILLSTFNGEQYLRDQLASFTAQTHADWQLYWRDDGSSDATIRLMTTFARTTDRCIPDPPGPRLRATRSFLALLRTALQGPAEFFAYADQDDVWLPEKLAHGVAALGNLPRDRPGLYFCARTLVDAKLTPVGNVLAPRRPPGFPAALTYYYLLQNVLTIAQQWAIQKFFIDEKALHAKIEAATTASFGAKIR